MDKPQGQPARLKDIINYEPEMYITEEEKAWIRATFAGNRKAITTLRKFFLPTATDLPIEDMQNDVFMFGLDWRALPVEEAKAIAVGRQDALSLVMNGLVQLQMFANLPVESPDELARKNEKNSSK